MVTLSVWLAWAAWVFVAGAAVGYRGIQGRQVVQWAEELFSALCQRRGFSRGQPWQQGRACCPLAA
eukprot:800769-Lingulodinium_polyedra.AAC.1